MFLLLSVKPFTSAPSCYQVRDQVERTDHAVTLSIWRSVCGENHLLIYRVANLQS